MFHLFYDCTKSAFDTSQQIQQHFKQTKVLYNSMWNEKQYCFAFREDSGGGFFFKYFVKLFVSVFVKVPKMPEKLEVIKWNQMYATHNTYTYNAHYKAIILYGKTTGFLS